MDAMNPEESIEQELFGDLSVSPGLLDFGYVEPGRLATDSIILGNTGTLPIDISSIDFVGSNVFAIDSAGALPESIAPDGEVVLSLSFAPAAEAAYSGAVAIQTNLAGFEYLEIDVVGTGTLEEFDTSEPVSNPLISVDISSINFGQVDLGSLASATALISNDGPDSVMVSSIDFTDPAFFWGQEVSLPYILSAGSAKEVTFTFSPTAESTVNGWATINSDDPALPEYDIELIGEGADLCSVCAPVISVSTGGNDDHNLSGFLSLLGIKDRKDVTVLNTGDEPLEISSITLNNDNAFPEGVFKLDGAPTGTTILEPYQTLSFTVIYKATATGIDIAMPSLDQNVIHILSNDQRETDYVIGLSGLGL
tara:strand:- start:223 stop:1320 length:1098 start_codon:yes stop_codon:yes gene_type:complete